MAAPPGPLGRTGWKRPAAFAFALILLNLSLTFENLWPTPAVTWHGEFSVELAVLVIALALIVRPGRRIARGVVLATSAIWLLLVLGRYADVTAPALYGRDINLYWDIRYVSDVTAMITKAAPTMLVVLVAFGVALVLAGLFLAVRWAIARVVSAMHDAAERRIALALAAVLVVCYAAQTISARVPAVPPFAVPVTATYAHQASLIRNARAGGRVLAPSPSMDAQLSLVANTDVFLVFIESYGAVAYDKPEFNSRLIPSRTALADAIHDTGRDVVSTFVQSPTFGGSSWFAHISLLSGIEVRDPDTDALLMTQQRDTLAKAFARNGHRTVGWMPGLKQAWPEGSFYGFDEIYNAKKLAYSGPEFGWFAIPDQFSFARLDQAEVSAPNRKPLFVFFPTLSTHTPFSPTPPYQQDWPKVLSSEPFDPYAVDRAYEEQQQIDWLNLSPNYSNAVAYAYTVVAGYLRWRLDRDFVMILLSDHQPPALVSGEGATWDVPVHVIASRGTERAKVLERLRERGFVDGMTPRHPTLARMHELLPILLKALS